MLILTTNQYLSLGLETLYGQLVKNPRPEFVIFIPENQDEIYAYLRSSGDSDPVMLFLFVLSSCRIMKKSRNGTAGDFLNISPEIFVNRGKKLSPREREILSTLLQGASYRMAAEKFSISEKTVCLHKHKAVRKLGVKNFHRLYLTYRYWQQCLRLQSDLSWAIPTESRE